MNHQRRMVIRLASIVGTAALVACSSSSSKSAETTAAKLQSERNDVLERMDDATQVVTKFGDKVPASESGHSRCVISIPSMVKGGVIVGGEGGKGFATCQTANGWSAPAPVSIGGGSIGAQLGVQSTELLALVKTEKGMRSLESGDFKVGVDASATAGPVGTGKGGSVNSDLVSYSSSKGLFAGAEMNGSTIKADKDGIKALYGSELELSAILGGKTAVPANTPQVERFMSAVSSHYGKKTPAKK